MSNQPVLCPKAPEGVDFLAVTTLDVSRVNLADIVFDESLWVRRALDEAAVRRYADALKAGQEFPPIDLARLDGALVLVDGRHRLEAHRQLGQSAISAHVTDMTRAEIQWASALRNLKHGVQLKRSERRRVFDAYVAAGQYKLGRNKYKTYREMGADLGLPFSTLRNWMRQDHRAIYDAIGDKCPDKQGPAQPELPDVRLDDQYLSQARAAIENARGLAGLLKSPVAVGEVVSLLQGSLQEVKSRPHEMPVRVEDNPNF